MKNIITNFSWVLVSNIFNSIFLWGILVILTKTSGPELVGFYAFALLINAPIYMFFDMQLKNVYMSKSNLTDKNSLYAFRIQTIFIAFAYSIIAAFIFNEYFSLILIVGIVKAIDWITEFNIGIFQDKFEFQKAGIGLLIKVFLSLISFIIGIYFFSSLEIALILTIVSKLLVIIFYDYKHIILRNFVGFFSLNDFNITFKKYYPLGVVLFLVSLNGSFPRFCVERFIGVYELGIYAALAYFMSSGSRIFNSMMESYFPTLRDSFQNDKIAYRKNLKIMILFISLLSLCGAFISYFFAEDLIVIFYSKEFLELNIFYILVLSLFISFFAKFIDLLLILHSAYKYNMYSLMVSFLVNLISILILITDYKLEGVAISVLLSMIAYFCSNLIALKRC